MKFLIFAASHRPGSLNRKLATIAADHIKNKGAIVDFAEYSEFDMPIYNDSGTIDGAPVIVRSFADRAAKADGIIVSAPEYNWSYPGSLKTIIDWTSRIKPNPLAGKTALLMSATTGTRGGIVGLTHLRLPFEALSVYVFPRAFPLPEALSAFDTEGRLTSDTQQNRLAALLDEYVTFTAKLSNH